ncbi:MAG: tetratricopeptide repeat protein [Blastocatellia bacterium]
MRERLVYHGGRGNVLLLAFALSFVLLVSFSVAAQNSSPMDARLEQAAALIRQNHLVEAEQALARILKATPGEARALNLLGTIRGSQRRFDEAESLFTKAITADPQLAGAHMNLAYLYLLKGAPDRTINELKEVLRIEPNNADALTRLAQLLLSQARVDECIGFLESAKTAQSSASLFILLGDAYLSKGEAARAEENYRAALDKQNDLAEALLGLAQVAQFKGDAKETALYLSRAKPLIARSPNLLYQFALIALKSDAIDAGRAALVEAVKLRGDQPAYFLALGDAWLKKPDLFEAEQAFRRALELQPDNALGQMYLGYALLKQKKYPEARAYLRKSMLADPNRPETIYYLGVVAQEQNEDEQAVELMKNLARRFPSFASAHIALGIAYLRAKDYPRARDELELAVRLDAEDPRAHYNLAMLFARLKDSARAQQEMQMVERLKNSKSRAQDAELFAPSAAKP